MRFYHMANVYAGQGKGEEALCYYAKVRAVNPRTKNRSKLKVMVFFVSHCNAVYNAHATSNSALTGSEAPRVPNCVPVAPRLSRLRRRLLRCISTGTPPRPPALLCRRRRAAGAPRARMCRPPPSARPGSAPTPPPCA